MIIAVDVGNTNIVLGLMEDERIVLVERLATQRNATVFEYALRIRDALSLGGAERPEGGIISSVVPSVTGPLSDALELVCGFRPIVVGPGIRTDMNILTDNPAATGSDRIVDAVAARALFSPPLMVLDMGTANTISVLNADGEFIGGVIMPGLRLTMEALSRAASLLPQVSYDPPRSVIGRNTVDSMKSGLLYGCASTLDGVIARIKDELGCDCPVVATGGMAPTVVPLCRQRIVHDPHLLLRGLGILYGMNNTFS